MRTARAALLAAGVLVAAVVSARAGRADVVPGCGTFALPASSGGDRWTLPHGFVRPGTDSVWTRRGALVRGRDYVLDAVRGELRVLPVIAPGETLWVACCWLLDPPPVELWRQRWQPLPPESPAAAAPRESTTAAPVRAATGRDLRSAPGGASLAVTGNKTVAVEFGSSQDAALRQSLDLAVSGTLAPGVELTGVLSDRNTPLAVQGSTQDLQSLDRVLLELRAPHANASLGDIPLSVQRGQFARFDRQVQGMRGEWHAAGFTAAVAAASAQGEYTRVSLQGIDGLQGPYELTDRDGATGITVVAGSEVVTLDGQRLARGESADYSMDYERGRLTFTNRRPITSSSRITVEYQYALNRYRRNLATFSGEWEAPKGSLWAAAITESDDRGRPLDATLDAQDLAALAAAGDSPGRAIGPGLVAGAGDYDTVRVALGTGTVVIAAWAGPDSGAFTARFARVTAGAGDYTDSAVVAGRTAYRWVGPGRGAYVLGRALPLPETHRVLSLGGATSIGALRIEAEGATSRRDLNTASSLDDAQDVGGASRVALTLAGAVGALPGTMGVQVGARAINPRFVPFTRLERPYAEEDWGLAAGADLDHQRRGDAAVFWRPRPGSELRADVARLTTPDGYAGTRRGAEWTGALPLRAHVLWLDASGRRSGLGAGDAGRRRLLAEVGHAGRWLAPSLRFERDDRTTPGDTVGARARVHDLAGELASGTVPRWKWRMGLGRRTDRGDVGAATSERRATTLGGGAESPAGGALGVAVAGQHRVTSDVASGSRTTSDLASVKLRGERRPWGLSGSLDAELTSEADNVRLRTLTFVGAGRGSYDALGNYVGTGDYELALAVTPTLDRYARTATSARAGWQFGSNDAWRGSRLDLVFDGEARRRGGPRAGDAFLGAGSALGDADLARGAVTQRIEGDVAPGSHVAAFHVRAERRVVADRTYGNFAQATDQRTGALRWRARPGTATTLEAQAQFQWQRAEQSVVGGASYARTLLDQGGTGQFVWQPGPALRAAGVFELDFARPEGQVEATRTIRLGPDLGAAVGPRGRAEVSVRRAFVSGPPAVALLPSADPAGFARWDANLRFDLRLHETTTFGVTGLVRERPGRATVVNGRAEVRAFF